MTSDRCHYLCQHLQSINVSLSTRKREAKLKQEPPRHRSELPDWISPRNPNPCETNSWNEHAMLMVARPRARMMHRPAQRMGQRRAQHELQSCCRKGPLGSTITQQPCQSLEGTSQSTVQMNRSPALKLMTPRSPRMNRFQR